MDRETKVTLHRNRDGASEDRVIDAGASRVKRSEYFLMDGATVYQPNEIDNLARQFGLLEEGSVAVDKDGALFS